MTSLAEPIAQPSTISQPLPPPLLTGPVRRTRGRPLRWMLLLAVFVIGAVIDRDALLLVPFLFVAVVPFEKLFPRHRQPLRRPGLGTDVTYGIAQPVLALAGLAVGAVVGLLSLAWLPGLALRPLVELLPPVPRMALGVVLFDLVTYWVHRWGHEVPFLWRFHAIHHSTRHLDWISGLRAHPMDGAFLAPPFLFLVAAGFTPELAGALVAVQVITGLFLHANVRWRWRPLHRVVITPEFHHWHHADEPDAHNTNYSVLLPVWDIVFGTYFMPRDRRPVRYGVTPALPDGIVPQLRHPFLGLPGPRWVARHPGLAGRRLVRALIAGVRQVQRSTLRPVRSS